MDVNKTIGEELNKGEKIGQGTIGKEALFYKKEYDLYSNNKKYKLTIEIKKEDILFTLEILSEISCYNYINKYKYNNLIKDLNLSIETNNDINKILEYFDSKISKNNYKIIDENQNKKLIINNKEIIILKETLIYNNNDDIIKILIKEINSIKEINYTISAL